MKLLTKEITIKNKSGLHSRPSTLLVETAKRFSADIRLIQDQMSVDSKSILDVMSLGCALGTRLTITARGKDAEEALEALAKLISNKFGEE
ncbi:MAG: HPr family phosphocarrier protein [Thermodesulfobacteriota bacterium]|nr:HPr family phosphocarrier protein [Thermodesulfobacteriota bacterium]